MRVLLALGGNAMTNADGRARPEDQIAAAEVAMEAVADLVAAGVDVVVTHGNGPQVGNLLVKNELAAAVVPPVPLDWCGAQTQATLGFVLLERARRARCAARGVRAADRRARDAHPGRPPTTPASPTRPSRSGATWPRDEARVLVEHGETWEDRGDKGWRRVVASPEPLEIVDAAGRARARRGGLRGHRERRRRHPRRPRRRRALRGVEAVIDKDLGAALLARTVEADVLVIATDVPHAVLRCGSARGRAARARSRSRGCARYAAEGHFASGSMGPKVDAACRFVEDGGTRAVITSLDHIVDAVDRRRRHRRRPRPRRPMPDQPSASPGPAQ